MNVLALTYWSFNEPLVQSAALPHLRSIREAMGSEGRIFLLTLEKSHIQLSGTELDDTKALLEKEGIYLIPKKYHRFGIKAVLSWIVYIFSLWRHCKKEKISCVHAFATPIGSAAYILSRLTGIPFVVDSYEPHAESMVENGSWNRNSFVHKLLLFFEKRQTRYALATLSATPDMPEYAGATYGVEPACNYYRPAGVDLDKFIPGEGDQELKEALGLKSKVCIYAGKFGGIYLEEEVFLLFKKAFEIWDGDFSALLLTDSHKEDIHRMANKVDCPVECLSVLNLEHEEVPVYMKLADFAVNPVKPVPSKKYCTSIKDGEYWASGLPVIIPPRISNDSDIIEENKIGVIWKGFNVEECEAAVVEMKRLLESENKEVLAQRIRDVAKEERDFEIYKKWYRKIYSKDGLVDSGQQVFVVLIYNSFADPLFQNLMYRYILTQSERHPNYRFELLTFDMKKYALDPDEKLKTQLMLSSKGIYWQPLAYHSGRFLLFKKLYDFSHAMLKSLRIRFYSRPIMTLSFANNAAAITILLSKLLGTKHMVYGYEPHSEFMAEFGIWSRNSLKYKVLKRLETLTDRTSDYIVTGTSHLKNRLESGPGKAQIYRAPCSVDEEIFKFYPEDRLRKREELGLEGKKVLIYVGKFGGVYYNEELPIFVHELQKQISELYFLVLSPNDHEELHRLFGRCGLSSENYHITEAKGAREVAAWNSAADLAITAIPPLPSQKFRSPVKVGEYLMCGLPFITCKGVSEDDIWARKHDVGIVIDEMKPEEAVRVVPEIQKYWSEPVEQLRDRCREAGIQYRSKRFVDEVFEKILSEVVKNS